MNEGNFLCLKSWSSLCQPKAFDGFGFRRMKDMNKVLLAKLGWKVLTEPKSLWVQCVKVRYCNCRCLFSLSPRLNGFWGWKNILIARDLLKKCCCFKIGNGSTIDIWKDFWIPWNEEFMAKSKLTIEASHSILVNSIFNRKNKNWNVD